MVHDKLITLRGPGVIYAGFNAIQKLPAEAKALGARKALLVTDPGVLQAGIGAKARELLAAAGIEVEVFDRVVADPDVACAEACVKVAKAGDYDLIIGLGGGSSMDVAAIAAVMCTNPGAVADYFGANLVVNPGVPTILIPTTAGTGAEVTPNAVLTDPSVRLKKAIVSPHILPRVAIVDPLLTVSMPPRVTAFSGLDALAHAVEAYTANNATPLTDIFAREGIALIGRSLRAAAARGSNLEARYDMSIGSMYAGIALAHAGVNAVHALSYPLSGEYGVPHGVANGLLLPYVMEFNVLGDIAKFAEMALLMGEEGRHLTLVERARRAPVAVKALCDDLPVPHSLTELGVPKEAIARFAVAAVGITRLMDNNPRAMTVADAERIYARAL